jgi:hypothetical protein
MLLKKGLDKPSQLQPREQTQMGRLVLVRASNFGRELQKPPLSAMAQKQFNPAARQWTIALEIAVCYSDEVRKAGGNHLALEAHG